MEKELQKRNTDCVYFLASPLTCKKGIDCEYRHCEIARLNPRDCWYWLAGNCLNPACGFRHPPLEKYTKSPSETVLSSELANKTNMPCYFYFSSFCNKGDKCSFMHGDDPNIAAGKYGNMSSEVREVISLDDEKRVANDNMSSLEASANYLSEKVPKQVMDLKFQPKEDVQLANPNNVILRSPLQIAVSQGEEAVSLKSDSLLHADGFVRGRSLICTDQSSKLQVEDEVELEDRWESSPGFDVLVDDESEDDGSENLFCHENDRDYLQAFERGHRELIKKECRELCNRLFGYDFEDMVGYDPANCGAEDMCEGETYDSFDCVDNICIVEDTGNCSARSSGRPWGSLLSCKRKLLPVELAINDRRVVDLRDHLRKRRSVDGHRVCQSSRMNDSSHLLCHNRKWTQIPDISQQLHGRLASEVRKIALESHVDNETLFDGSNQRGFLRPSRSNRFRLQQKVKRLAKRQFFISEVPRKPVPKERRFSQASTEFTGPKTLAQIKEEKKTTEANGVCPGKTGNSIRMALADFEGPKSLSEILKDKKSGSGQ